MSCATLNLAEPVQGRVDVVSCLSLTFEQLPALSLQFGESQFQLPIFTIQVSAQSDKVSNFIFESLDEFLSHGDYTWHLTVATIGGALLAVNDEILMKFSLLLK
ncbi:MAG: hypothetical protein VW317_05755 [Halieaceae bacterium]